MIVGSWSLGPIRPSSGSLRDRLIGSTPNVSPSTFSSMPSSQPATTPAMPSTTDLPARAARCERHWHGAEIVLADRRRRQVDAQLRHVAQNERGKGIRVGAGPDTVSVSVWIVLHRCFDAFDERVDAWAAHILEQLRLSAEPTPIGRPLARDHCGSRSSQPIADHLVDRELICAARFHRDPGVHAEIATPADRARRIHLYDGFGRRSWIRRETHGLAARRPPVARTDFSGLTQISRRAGRVERQK